MLEARGLVKAYRAPAGPPIRALDGVSLTVAAGQVAVVLGASGSGKSTLLNVVGLLEDADAGEVRMGGERVSALGALGPEPGSRPVSRLRLPVVPAAALADRARQRAAGRPLRWPPRARPAPPGRELLAELGVAERAGHYPTQLSGGEQQRVAFCRAVLNDPPLLLADEPTGNLDDANGRAIWESLRARARAGAAVVVVTHRADAVAGTDAVYRMDHGRLDAGPPISEGDKT